MSLASPARGSAVSPLVPPVSSAWVAFSGPADPHAIAVSRANSVATMVTTARVCIYSCPLKTSGSICHSRLFGGVTAHSEDLGSAPEAWAVVIGDGKGTSRTTAVDVFPDDLFGHWIELDDEALTAVGSVSGEKAVVKHDDVSCSRQPLLDHLRFVAVGQPESLISGVVPLVLGQRCDRVHVKPVALRSH